MTNFKKMLISYHKLLKYDNHKVLTGRKYYLRRSLKGLTSLNTLPGAVFFNSIRTNYWGVREAHALKLPSAAILDTDSDPADVLYPVPGNDDAFGSIYFLNQLVAKTILITKIGRLLKFGSKKALFSKFNKNLLNRSGKGRGQGG